MTIREEFDRRKRRLGLLFMASFALFAGGFMPSPVSDAVRICLLVIGLGVMLPTGLYANLVAYRCPECGGPWNGVVMHMGRSPFRIDRRIRHCPFCGVDLDTEGKGKPKAKAADPLD